MITTPIADKHDWITGHRGGMASATPQIIGQRLRIGASWVNLCHLWHEPHANSAFHLVGTMFPWILVHCNSLSNLFWHGFRRIRRRLGPGEIELGQSLFGFHAPPLTFPPGTAKEYGSQEPGRCGDILSPHHILALQTQAVPATSLTDFFLLRP